MKVVLSLVLILICAITNAKVITINPSNPVVLNIDRIIDDLTGTIVVAKPSTSFKLHIDNSKSAEPLSITEMQVIVDGPMGTSFLTAKPSNTLFELGKFGLLRSNNSVTFAKAEAFEMVKMADQIIIVGGLQPYHSGEVPPIGADYKIIMTVSGFYGDYLNPVGNFSEEVSFTATSL